jgi:hypothetical protein
LIALYRVCRLTPNARAAVKDGLRPLRTLPFNVSLSVKKVATNTPETFFEVLCGVRFTGFDKCRVGRNGSAIRTGNETAIGQIIVAKDAIWHEQSIAATLATVRGRLKSANLNCVVHI